MTKPTLSFEFFPPKTDAARAHFWENVETLSTLDPSFVTVTYGAGGSTRNWTIDTAIEVHQRTGLPTAAHLTALGTPRADIKDMAAQLWNGGVRHIVALRGDMPKDPEVLKQLAGMDCYQYSNELVAGLRSYFPFEISVGAYPEKHPEAASNQADIDALRHKCDAGADRAITQFFFENDTYFDFVDRVRAAGLNIPIVAGVLPISSFPKMLAFAKACRAHVPEWMHERFAGVADHSDEMKKIGGEILAEQCQNLIERGASHIHFYTLNRADMIVGAWQKVAA